MKKISYDMEENIRTEVYSKCVDLMKPKTEKIQELTNEIELLKSK